MMNFLFSLLGKILLWGLSMSGIVEKLKKKYFPFNDEDFRVTDLKVLFHINEFKQQMTIEYGISNHTFDPFDIDKIEVEVNTGQIDSLLGFSQLKSIPIVLRAHEKILIQHPLSDFESRKIKETIQPALNNNIYVYIGLTMTHYIKCWKNEPIIVKSFDTLQCDIIK